MCADSRIESLALAAVSGQLSYTIHYNEQLDARPTPSKSDILFMLCDDDPIVIEEYPDESRGNSCLIWATNFEGIVGHIVCTNFPKNVVITAYYPGLTRPEEWENDFRRRRSEI